jgi:hypothetical protein
MWNDCELEVITMIEESPLIERATFFYHHIQNRQFLPKSLCELLRHLPSIASPAVFELSVRRPMPKNIYITANTFAKLRNYAVDLKTMGMPAKRTYSLQKYQ